MTLSVNEKTTAGIEFRIHHIYFSTFPDKFVFTAFINMKLDQFLPAGQSIIMIRIIGCKKYPNAVRLN